MRLSINCLFNNCFEPCRRHHLENFSIKTCFTVYTRCNKNIRTCQLTVFFCRSIHEGTKEFSARCPECGKVFNDRGYLSSHLKIHRDRKEYACPHCPKRFNQRVAYNMHLRIHTGELQTSLFAWLLPLFNFCCWKQILRQKYGCKLVSLF